MAKEDWAALLTPLAAPFAADAAAEAAGDLTVGLEVLAGLGVLAGLAVLTGTVGLGVGVTGWEDVEARCPDDISLALRAPAAELVPLEFIADRSAALLAPAIELVPVEFILALSLAASCDPVGILI